MRSVMLLLLGDDFRRERAGQKRAVAQLLPRGRVEQRRLRLPDARAPGILTVLRQYFHFDRRRRACRASSDTRGGVLFIYGEIARRHLARHGIPRIVLRRRGQQWRCINGKGA